MSYRFRFIFGNILILVIGFALLLFFFQKEIRPRYREVIEDSLVSLAHLSASAISLTIKSQHKPALDTDMIRRFHLEMQRQPLQARIFEIERKNTAFDFYVTDPNGIVIYHSKDPNFIGHDFSQWNEIYRTLRGQYGARSTHEDDSTRFSSVFYVAAPILVDNILYGVISVSKPEMALDAFLLKTQKRFILLLLAVALGTVSLNILFSYWMTLSIQRIVDYVDRVRHGERVVLPKFISSAFQKLVNSFEEMRISLEGRKVIENYVQSLTHEIKSPISGIQSAAELLKENPAEEKRVKFIEIIFLEVTRIKNLVDYLLKLASLESKSTLEVRESISLVALINTVVDRFQIAAHKNNIQIHIKYFSDIKIFGDPFLLEQAIGNLIQNSLDFSKDGQTIQITMKKTASNDQIEIQILDEAGGIPEYALNRVFEKFYSLERPTTKMKSSGLGLAFVKEIVALHHGKIEIENYYAIPNIKGLRVLLTLPL